MFTQAPFALTPIASVVVAVSNPYDPYWANVVLLCPFDVSTTDVRGGLTPSASNAVDVTGVGKFNTGLKLTALNSSLKYAANANYSFGTAPFTIDGWITAPTLPANFYIFDIGANGFYLHYYNGAWEIAGQAISTGITLGVPFFFEVNRSGATLNLFIDGNLILSRNIGASTALGGNSVLTIGCYGGGGNYSLAGGVIDDFRITKGIQRNSGSYAKPTTAAPTSASEGNQVVRLWNFDNNYLDSKINDAPTVSTGVSLVAGKFGNGVKFASASSVLRYAASADYYFGVLPFTIAGWLQKAAAQSTGDYIYVFDIGVNGLMLQWSPGVGGWYLYGNGGALGQFTQALAGDVFTHFELVRNGTALMLFINGTMVINVTVNAATTFGSNSTLTIGAHGGGGYAPINGIIDDFEVIKGYARHTANFTPPTIPYSTTTA